MAASARLVTRILRTGGALAVLVALAACSSTATARRAGRGVAADLGVVGGDDGTRTHDPLLAKQVLFQLSYIPGENYL
jgi:hypothetical protein